jgi:hypothetical protein
MKTDITLSRILLLIAVITFVLVGFGVTLGTLTPLELGSFGLAFFAAGFVV